MTTVASTMQAPAFVTSGALVDLAALTPDDIDFAAMASTLSKIARFNGINQGPAYSVGQHSVMGADALFRETGDGILAGYFLLHDGHEYLIGDITRPALQLIRIHLAELLGSGSELIRDAVSAAKASIDAEILQAAGLPPIDRMPVYKRQVHEMDERMCFAEARALFHATGPVPLIQCDLPAPKLTGGLRPWGAMKAEEAFVDRLGRYLGIFVRSAG